MIIEHDLPYSPISASVEADATVIQTPNAKFHQRAELKRVENIYEAMLLKETSFPRASDSNQEIEEWTNAVIANWRFLCGPAWTDEDLGEGGKEAVGRGVLDVSFAILLVSIQQRVSLTCTSTDTIPCGGKDIPFNNDTPSFIYHSRVAR
jgi:hypothetical protein